MQLNTMMHMADGLISLPIGGLFYLLVAFFIGYAIKKTGKKANVALMAVMGAFVFAGQMINFTIPGTGSSGHILGSILLAITVGQYPAFLSMVAVLAIQCVLFGDGGLLALGCNIFNMGFLPIFVAYPLIVRPLLNKGINNKNIALASILGCLVGIECGALSVTLQTLASHITALPFTTFLALMLPIHVAIGLVEGLITTAVVIFVNAQSPNIISDALNREAATNTRRTTIVMTVLSVLVAGGLSLLASSNPDGLEWSIENVTGSTEVEDNNKTKKSIAEVQEKTSLLPDYNFKGEDSAILGGATGVIGVGVVLVVAGAIGLAITKKKAHE